MFRASTASPAYGDASHHICLVVRARSGPGLDSTHSRRSASVGTVGKHLFFDSVLNRCRGFARSPEIIAGNPCRNGSVYGNPAYEAFPCVHPSPIRVSVPLLLRPQHQVRILAWRPAGFVISDAGGFAVRREIEAVDATADAQAGAR